MQPTLCARWPSLYMSVCSRSPQSCSKAGGHSQGCALECLGACVLLFEWEACSKSSLSGWAVLRRSRDHFDWPYLPPCSRRASAPSNISNLPWFPRKALHFISPRKSRNYKIRALTASNRCVPQRKVSPEPQPTPIENPSNLPCWYVITAPQAKLPPTSPPPNPPSNPEITIA